MNHATDETQSLLIKQVFLDKTNSVPIQLLRYVCVGAAAFIVDFSMLYVFTEYLGIHYLCSAALAFIGGVLTNYTLSIWWVFDARSVQNRWIEVGVFALIGVIGLGLNEVMIWTFTEKARFHYLVSKIMATVFVFAWNFIARKMTLFRC